ncbi:MAG: phenylacetate--CoA ligase family protein [Acidobacteriota bacterium]
MHTTPDFFRSSVLSRAGRTVWIGAYALWERRVPFFRPETIERLQRWRLQKIIRHAWQTVPFYQKIMTERGLRPSDFRTAKDLEKLPLIGFSDVARDPRMFRSSLYPDRSCLCLQTAGSSRGFGLRIYWDRASALNKVAHAERDRVVLARLAGRNWGQDQIHVIGRSSGRVRRYVEAGMLTPQRLIRRVELTSDTPVEQVADRINQVRPQVVFSYGSFAEIFFRTIRDSGKPVCWPRVWCYGGDALAADVRRMMEEQGCTVHSTYQATETGRLGFECECRRGFHLNIDLCAVRLIETGEHGFDRINRNPPQEAGTGEPLRSDWTPGAESAVRNVPAGEVGELVISNLHNRAMVLLNLRLGDLGVIDPAPCECGRSLPVLKELRGRVSQLIRRSDGTLISALTLRHLMADQFGLALQSQIVYQPPGLFIWRIVPATGKSGTEVAAAFKQATERILGPGIRVEVQIAPALPVSESGKFRTFVQRT